MKTSELVARAEGAVDALDPEELKRLGLLPRHDLFFPAIYYPPLTMYPRAEAAQLLPARPLAPKDLSLYVHIPHCASRCTYCHWVVSLNDAPSQMDAYLDHLEKEMDAWRARFAAPPRPSSVLIGGGTPTLLSAAQLRRLIEALRRRFDLSACRQFSVEAEPTTLLGREGRERLAALAALGVDRVSMGVQSFDDEALKRMARPHDGAQAREAIEAIRAAGIGSLSIDLIYGLAGQTPASWAATLDQAVSLGIDACQLYRLRIVPHGDKAGAVASLHGKDPARFPTLRETYVMKALGRVVFESRGFSENLRRIFSREPSHVSYYLRDYGCRLYDVLGLGVSAWSSLGGRTLLNTGVGVKDYCDRVAAGGLAVDRGLIRGDDTEARRAFVLPLKGHGVSKASYRALTGRDPESLFEPKLRALELHGLLERDARRVVLTERGGFFADEVVMQFYEPRFLPHREADYEAGPLNPHRRAAAAAA